MRDAGRRLAACLVLALTAGCADLGARSPDGRREVPVEAEGWAPMAEANTLDARRRALAEAQKKAVEKAVGVTVRARTRVDDAVSVQQSIEANMGGTIRSYEVTSEGEEGGFFKVRIRAVVIYRPLDVAVSKRTSPRLLVRIASEKAAGAVRNALAARDFEVVESEAEADVVVTGVVEIRGLSDPRLGGFFSYTSKVSLTAANLRSGKVARVEDEASSVDTEEEVARDQSLENAGDRSGAALAADIAGGEAAGAPPPTELSDARTGPPLPGMPGF